MDKLIIKLVRLLPKVFRYGGLFAFIIGVDRLTKDTTTQSLILFGLIGFVSGAIYEKAFEDVDNEHTT